MGKSQKKAPSKRATADKSQPILPQSSEACDCCADQPNGLVYCFDGALQVSPFPTTGDGAYPKWVPGVGWVWINAALIEPGIGRAVPAEIPPSKPFEEG